MKLVQRMMLLALALMMFAGTGAMACTDWCGIPDIDVNSDVLPSPDELHTEAYLLGDAMIGRTVHVLMSGNVRTAPNQSSRILTEVFPDDKVAILDYYMESMSPLRMWLKIDFYGMEGWISASRGKIVTCPADSYTIGNDPALEAARNRYVGQTMLVNANSGNARSGPGTEYPILEFIRRPETHIIRNVALDSQGNLWVMVRIGSRECWARATLFSYIGD